ncbi:acyltransferase [Frondihabitans sp. PhB188]|uniref:acyltransferase family protein n=1 Tax=Frondihabitans sp. PhB188 TaxID=2485200 RepID=UPI000F48F955|nr:acyltransferase [Frondihabitans sp. PhB188]
MGESQERTHLAGLDGLRGLAAVSVVAYHVSNVLSPGVRHREPGLVFALHQGLGLFFVLSGFLLYLGFAGRLVDGRPLPSLRRYAANRAFRVWPAYLVVLLVTNCVLGLSFVWPRGIGRLDAPGLAADLTMMQAYSPHHIRTGLEVAWTLTVELTFYAVLPLVALLASRVGRRLQGWQRASLPPLVLLVVGAAGALVRAVFHATHGRELHGWGRDWESVVSRSLLMHGQLFAFGMAAALVYLAVRRGAVSATVARFGAVTGGVAAGALALSHRRWESADTLAALAFAAVLVVAVTPTRTGATSLLGRLLDTHVLQRLGLVSYSVYLWHMPVVRGLAAWVPGFGAGGGWAYVSATAAVVGLTLVLAKLTYVLVEQPALRLRSIISRRMSAQHARIGVEPSPSDRNFLKFEGRGAGTPQRDEAATPKGDGLVTLHPAVAERARSTG